MLWCFCLFLAAISLLYADGVGGASTANTVMVLSETRKRRERYSGKFPRKYSLKYKELQNNDTIIDRGVYSLSHSLTYSLACSSLKERFYTSRHACFDNGE